jgi:outer membrane scaffolding protein for murein synthesis (MipA/OmpV family)
LPLLLACACTFGAIGPAIADEERPWELQLGAGIAYVADYSGSCTSGRRLRLWADGKYRTNNFGTFALDSGSLTIDPEFRWDFVDRPDIGAGVLVGYRFGRTSSNPGLTSTNDGSARLAGVAGVSGAFDAGLAGHAMVFGVPLFAQVRSALSGTQGTLVNVGAFLPVSPVPSVELVFLPTLAWANARQMRAFYGVTIVESAASGFAAHVPGAGWENAAIEMSADWSAGGGLHLIASFAYQRLLDGAASSPIVQTRNQTSALAGIAWSF